MRTAVISPPDFNGTAITRPSSFRSKAHRLAIIQIAWKLIGQIKILYSLDRGRLEKCI